MCQAIKSPQRSCSMLRRMLLEQEETGHAFALHLLAFGRSHNLPQILQMQEKENVSSFRSARKIVLGRYLMFQILAATSTTRGSASCATRKDCSCKTQREGASNDRYHDSNQRGLKHTHTLGAIVLAGSAEEKSLCDCRAGVHQAGRFIGEVEHEPQ